LLIPIIRFACDAVSGLRRARSVPACSTVVPALRAARPALRVTVAAVSVAATTTPLLLDPDPRRRTIRTA